MKTFLILILLLTPLVFLNMQRMSIVSVAAFGAVGDGITDDGPAIKAALNSTYTEIYLDPGKVYKTSINLVVPSGKTFNGNYSTLKPYSSTLPAISYSLLVGTKVGANYNKTSLSISIPKGASTFSFPYAGDLAPGDLIYLQGQTFYTTPGGETYRNGHYTTIAAISGTTVTMDYPTMEPLTATALSRYPTIENVHITKLVVDLRGRSGGKGIGLVNATGSLIDFCTVLGTPGTGMDMGFDVQGIGNVVTKCKASGTKSTVPGYAFHGAGHSNTFSYCSASGSRHCFSSAWRDIVSTDINYGYDTASNAGGGVGTLFDYHASCYNSIITGCVGFAETPNEIAIALRGKKLTVSNTNITFNNAEGKTVRMVACFENGDEPTITGNTFTMYGSGTNYVMGNFAGMARPMKNVHWTGNYIKGGTFTLPSAIDTGLWILRNRWDTYLGVQAKINLTYAAQYRIEDNVFVNYVGSASNYSISTPSGNTSGTIKRDSVYIMNSANSFTQFKINNTTNTVQNNVICTPGNAFINDYTGSSLNLISANSLSHGPCVPGSFTSGTIVPADTTHIDPYVEPPITDTAQPPPQVSGLRVYWKYKQH
jgi:hypothetical protein